EVPPRARPLVRRVVEQLMEKLPRPVRSFFLGAADRRRRSLLKVAKNFDARTTVRRNLASFDPTSQRLFIRAPYFFSRVRRQADRWQVIIVVDESGSMADSVIHAAVTAAHFFRTRTLRTHLVLFDTSVVDVTADCADPLETIMKVQLGGGTDIGGGLRHPAGPVGNPPRAPARVPTALFVGGP